VSVLIIGISLVGAFMAVWAALCTPRRKVKWGDEYAPKIVTRLQMKGNKND
jgi:hypothetical protein